MLRARHGAGRQSGPHRGFSLRLTVDDNPVTGAAALPPTGSGAWLDERRYGTFFDRAERETLELALSADPRQSGTRPLLPDHSSARCATASMAGLEPDDE